MTFFEKYHQALFNCTKPYQYVGGEFLSCNKNFDDAKVRFALAFPDKYEIGISNLGLRVLYDRINSQTDFMADRVYAPEKDFKPEPLYALESKRPIKDFDAVGFSLQYELAYPTVLKMLEMAGIPHRNDERGEDDPIVLAGGPCVFNPLPMADFVDVFLIGDGEDSIVEVCEILEKTKGLPRAQRIKALTQSPKYNIDSVKAQKVELIRDFKYSRTENKKILKSIIPERMLTHKGLNMNVLLSRASISKMISSAYDLTDEDVKSGRIQLSEARHYRNLRLNLIANAVDIFENSQFVLKHDDFKKNIKNRKILRFVNAVISENTVFNVMFTAKQDGSNIKIETSLYDLKSKKIPAVPRRSQKPHTPLPESYTISITDLAEFVNSNLSKYNLPLKEFNTFNPSGRWGALTGGKVTKRIAMPAELTSYPIPFSASVHDRATVEIRRGCGRMCRFCQPGHVTLPVRERSAEDIIRITKELVRNTGYDEYSLLSLSSNDYSNIKEVIKELGHEFDIKKISVSLPSQRIDGFNLELANLVQSVRKSTMTLAPEAGSQRLRNLIKKNISEEQILDAVTTLYENGWKKIKLYFICGLPTETHEDMEEMAALLRKMKERAKGLQITCTLSIFVP
ncbi:MAG: radical SAM protein, partial [Heliobacteriaceae bacterium]|nr:radical SAM protein [Heliobacteriaceae bacterium]